MGVSGQRHAPAALLPPGKGPPVPIVQEAGWAPEPMNFKQTLFKLLILRQLYYVEKQCNNHTTSIGGQMSKLM
jgi:hypothetical protein